jgi:hypothetical protein
VVRLSYLYYLDDQAAIVNIFTVGLIGDVSGTLLCVYLIKVGLNCISRFEKS